jgi:hypothetical protein
MAEIILKGVFGGNQLPKFVVFFRNISYFKTSEKMLKENYTLNFYNFIDFAYLWARTSGMTKLRLVVRTQNRLTVGARISPYWTSSFTSQQRAEIIDSTLKSFVIERQALFLKTVEIIADQIVIALSFMFLFVARIGCCKHTQKAFKHTANAKKIRNSKLQSLLLVSANNSKAILAIFTQNSPRAGQQTLVWAVAPR